MRPISAILVVALGMFCNQIALAQDLFSGPSSNFDFRGSDPFVYAGLGMNDAPVSSPSGSMGGGLKIDTSRLVWESGASDSHQLEGLLHPLRLTPVAPAANIQPNPTATDGEANIVHNSPSRRPESPRNLDWRFLTAHGVYAGAVVFDDLITMKGLGRPCGFVEGNNELGPNPTAKSMAIHGLVEFAAVTTMDYFLKRTRVPGLSYIGAGIGTAKHLHGGIQWLNTGCF
jgi:hypothetical protein